MAQLNIAVAISGIDQGASSMLSGITGAMGGMADIAKNALGTALGILTANAIPAMVDGLKSFVTEGMQAEREQAQLNAVLASLASADAKAAQDWADAQGKYVTSTAMSAEETEKLQDKLTKATAKLHDLQAAWDKAKTHTESGALALQEAKDKVAALETQISDGSKTITTSLTSALGLVPPVARMTITELNDLADSLELITPVSAGATAAGEAMLLTFTNIGKDVFPEATRTLLDMATAMNSGGTPSAEQLKSQAIQLGKALNDPIAGISALSRVGVTFSEEQKATIATMIEMGDTAGAQGIILAELAKEFGGSAEAAGQTFGGQLQILTNQLDAMKETIGLAVIPVLSNLFETYIKPNIPVIQDFAKAFAQLITNFVDIVKNGADPVDAFGLAINSVFGGGVGGPVMAFIAGLKQGFSDLVTLLTPLGSALAGLFANLANNNAGGFFASLSNAGAALGGLWAQAQPHLAAFIQSVIAWVQQQAPVVWATLQAWGAAFIAWISPMIPPFLAALGVMLTNLWAWIQQQVPVLVAQLQTWAKAFTDWIAPMIPPFVQQLGVLIGTAVGWLLAQGLPMLITGLAQLIAALAQPSGFNAAATGNTLGGALIQGFLIGLAPFGAQIAGIITAATNTVKMIWGAFCLTLSMLTTIYFTAITVGIQNAINGISTVISTFFAGIQASWQGNWELFNTIVGTVWDKIKTAVGDAVGAVMKTIQPLLDMISNVWSNIQKLGTVNISLPSIPGFAGGADFIVPPGFPDDSFPMRVQSGERVQVTPAGQSAGGGALTINVDARGSSLTAAQIKSAVAQALAQAGYRADGMLRMGVA